MGIVERHLRGAQLTILLLIAALMLMRQWITLNENRQLLDQVAFQAEHDDLTGLLNRVGLLRRLAESVRAGAAVRVHLIDIDRFKDVNDTLGHPVGDALLIAVGHRLRACTRGLDVARLGGDEFAVIDLRHDGAGLAERLLAAVGEPYSAAGRSIHLDGSLGIAELAAAAGTAGANADQVAVDLLRDADSAMYAAKADGGGWRLFEDDLRDAMLDRVALGRELRDALARGGELSLAYQPIVDLASDGVPHVEALARWTSPRRGVVPPGVFIPIAEAAGLMPLLGTWVLRTACAQAAEWSRAGFDVGVCVNVSAQQAGAGLVHDVADVLRRTGLAPERLMLEVTESLFVADSEAANSPLEAVRASGVRIAIDDFGTGYSALAYLRRLPVDTLKVDRRFIARMDKADVAVLAAILEMARALGLQTVAGGSRPASSWISCRRSDATSARATSWPGRWTRPRCPGTSTPAPSRRRRRASPRGAQLCARRTEDPGMTTVRTALTGALLLDLPVVLAAPAMSTRTTAIAAAVIASAGAALAVAASRALSSWIDAAVARVDR